MTFITSNVKLVFVAILLFATATQFSCNQTVGIIPMLYTPPVTFSGYMFGDRDSLTGNSIWRNTVQMAKDTLKMTFWSRDYEEVNGVRNGKMVRIYIFPKDTDSLITGKESIVHFNRTLNQSCTFEIVPADSNNSAHVTRMYKIQYPSRASGNIRIENIYMNAPPTGVYCGDMLEVNDGLIVGRVN